MPDVLIIGCGYLGERAARLWLNRGRRVAALTRGRADDLRAIGIEPIVGDVTDPASLRELPEATTVLYAVGMDRSAGPSMRDVYVTGLSNVLETLPKPERFLYVSSTGVYGQDDGVEVDEDAPTEPGDPSGQIVLDAETVLRQQMPSAVILRFAGIYGPGRLMRSDGLKRGEPLGGDPAKWVNLIHVADGANVVLLAEQRAAPGRVYNVSDGHPVSRGEFYTQLAALIGAPVPTFEPHRPTPRDRGNRRISNVRLISELGFSPDYPSYREGLAALTSES